MKPEDLREAIQNIDVEKVEKSSRRMGWLKFAVPAACFVLAAAVCVAGIASVRGNKTKESRGNGKNVYSGDSDGDGEKDKRDDGATETYDDGVIGVFGLNKSMSMDEYEKYIKDGKTDWSGKSDVSDHYSPRDSKGSVPEYMPEPEYIRVPAEKKIPATYFDDSGINPVAGTLTAGEWKDKDNISDWVKLIRDNNWYGIAESRGLFSDSIIKVSVKDGDNACFNCKTELYEGDRLIYTARTDESGNAYLFYNINSKNQSPDRVKIADMEFTLDGKSEITADIGNAGIAIEKLDLMFMIDTTGSMGDELSYLKAELKDIVSRVAKEDKTLSINVSVNFYRDEGDDYTVKYYDFRNDIDECIKQIGSQSANGGGDYPEAVHTALDNAINGHQWRNDAVKLCVLVLDAPPHDESEIQGINAQIVSTLTDAASEGIRIIPVLCSGGDQTTEYLCRSFAVMTGGTFVFLTDDSGIGNSHINPTVGDHDVEPLNDCLVRIISGFCGIED